MIHVFCCSSNSMCSSNFNFPTKVLQMLYISTSKWGLHKPSLLVKMFKCLNVPPIQTSECSNIGRRSLNSSSRRIGTFPIKALLANAIEFQVNSFEQTFQTKICMFTNSIKSWPQWLGKKLCVFSPSKFNVASFNL